MNKQTRILSLYWHIGILLSYCIFLINLIETPKMKKIKENQLHVSKLN
jgi:hypothetical protein